MRDANDEGEHVKGLVPSLVLAAIGCGGTQPGTGGTDTGAPIEDGGAALDVPMVDSALDAGGHEEAPDGPAPYVLCDGTPRLRFRALIEPDVSQEIVGSGVRVENGYAFLMVDGTCAFWVNGGWVEDALARDRPIRTGQLSAMQALTLERQLPLGDLGTVADCDGAPGSVHLAVLAIRGEGSVARCRGSGAKFHAAWATVQMLAAELAGQAVPLDKAMRIAAVASGDGAAEKVPPYEWPGPLALETVFVARHPSGMDVAGVSHLVTDAAAASAMRALRDRYLADRSASPGFYVGWDGLRVGSAGTNALVFMRDALPYEDARGLITF